LLICFVENKYDAGWREKEKMHLIYWAKERNLAFGLTAQFFIGQIDSGKDSTLSPFR
jgi:hypothetical protein